MKSPINLQAEFLKLARKKQAKKDRHHTVQIGRYYPSILAQSCVRGQWNFYMMSIERGVMPDEHVLYTSEGNAWHDMLEEVPVWDATEKRVSMRVPLQDGTKITIAGRLDAERDDTIYDFKRTGWVPLRKPRFEHMLQIQFYMACESKPKGIVAYIGNYQGKFSITEFHVVLSDWYVQQMINRAIQLHMFLVHGEPPVCSCRDKRHEVEWDNYVLEKEKGKK